MKKLNINDVAVYTDFLVKSSGGKLVMANLLERSKYSIQSAISSIYNSHNITGSCGRISCYGDYKGFVKSFLVGKTHYTQGVVKSGLIYSEETVTTDDKINVFLVENEHKSVQDSIYEALYALHDLPLLKAWSEFLFRELSKKHLKPCEVFKTDDFSYEIKQGNLKTDMKNWKFFHLLINKEELDEIISEGLKSGDILISEKPQQPVVVKSVDDYFSQYGEHVVSNVLESLKPRLPRIPQIKYKAHTKTPFPIQAEVINGIVNHLKSNDYVILNGGMGVGKTFISSVSAAMGVRKTFISSVSAAMGAEGGSRTLVMGPGHMLRKWKEEILEEIPGASAHIVSRFSDVVKMRELEKPTKKEFYLFSKDFLKLSSELVPAVSRRANRTLPIKQCSACDSIHFDGYHQRRCSCGSTSFYKLRTGYKRQGVVCPDCSELAMPLQSKVTSSLAVQADDTSPLEFEDFAGRNGKNTTCGHCGSKLWMPNVSSLGTASEYARFQRENRNWIKVKIARNKSNKTFKTIYVHKKEYAKRLATGEYNEKNHSLSETRKTRKFAPAIFIKKMLGKGFFDFGIFDECHLYKSGDSAQGNAFGQIVKACKKSMLLTGTLAGGVATDLFYLLFRIDPQLMLSKGYNYDDVFRFAESYGVIEEQREYENEEVFYNKSSNGRQVGTKKILPGISPLVFSEFLINNTIFLDLGDFDSFLPKLNEFPVPVSFSSRQRKIYDEVQDVFKRWLKEKGGKKLLGQFLPTLLSLPDVNWLEPVIHPESGMEIFSFKEEPSYFYDEDGLLPKEKELINIVGSELEENRCCFVYCEYTSDSSKNVTSRLKGILEDKLNLHGEVAILKSSSPRAVDRMDWIKQKASEGVRVFITNPKNVETGLDFIFKKDGKVFNYPTIIFYQIGYNLFTAWQASARHRRLNQTEECRTYYMFYESTLQEVAVETLANKKAATAALQGTFSEEGLTAMANSIDPRVLLANALMNGSKSENLHKIFDKINERQEVQLSEEEKLMMENVVRSFKKDQGEQNQGEQMTFGEIAEQFITLMNVSQVKSRTGKGKNVKVEGQLTFA